MEREESLLLHEPDLMLAVLRVAASGQGTIDGCIEQLRALRRCARVRESVPEAGVRDRLAQVTARLERARLIEREGSRWRLTARGRKVLAEHPDGVDDSVLVRFPDYRRAKRAGSRAVRAADPAALALRPGLRGLRRGSRPRRQPPRLGRPRLARLGERLVAGARRRPPPPRARPAVGCRPLAHSAAATSSAARKRSSRKRASQRSLPAL